MQKHFVTFYSPGTFVAESTTQPIDRWDVEEARKRAEAIVERYGAKPYGFRFSTRARGEELDSREIASSPMYFLGGQVLTLAELEARNDPSDKILIRNMRGNGWDRVVRSQTPWSWTQPLREGDVVLGA